MAAGRGQREAVMYLVQNGANPFSIDARENSAFEEAKREKQTGIIEYLEAVTSYHVINNYCDSFGDGLLKKGI